jgi:hypothetical protein
MTLKGPINSDRAAAGDRYCEIPIHLHGSSPQAIDCLQNRLKVASDKEIERALPAQASIPRMDPNIDSLRFVDITELFDDVMDLKKAVALFSLRSRRTGGPVIDLTLIDACDLGDFSCSESGFANLIHDSTVETRVS